MTLSQLHSLAAFDQLRSQLTLVRVGRSSRVYMAYDPELNSAIVLKEFLGRNSFERIKQLFFESRAVRAARAFAAYERKGFNVPQVLQTLSHPSADRSVLVTRFVEGSFTVREVLEALVAGHDKLARRNLLNALAEEFARLYTKGLRHDDTNLGNILVAPDGDGYRFTWTDIDRTPWHFGLETSLRTNLRQLNKLSLGLALRDKFFFMERLLSNLGIADAKKWEYVWSIARAERERRALLIGKGAPQSLTEVAESLRQEYLANKNREMVHA